MPHVTFIHGISNKPPRDRLVDIWVRSLANNQGLDLDAEGATYSMVYWADIMYEQPEAEGGDTRSLESLSDAVPKAQEEDVAWQHDLSGAEKVFVQSLAAKLGYAQKPPGGDDAFAAPSPRAGEPVPFERIPLPWFLKRRLMKILLRDVHHYLFNATSEPRSGERFKVRDDIRKRFADALRAGNMIPGPHVVLSHSMGTLIAYDCLKRVVDCPKVDGFITIGSPLGLDEIQDVLGEDPSPKWTREDGFPHERVASQWVNVYDTLDPVCGFDPKFANDYRRRGEEVVRDINEQNYGKWRHGIEKYLGQPKLRAALREMLFEPGAGS